MEMNFNLSGINGTSNKLSRLAAWELHDVNFAGAKINSYQGKQDPTANYEVLVVRFENEKGYYEESAFFPKPEDTKRTTVTNKEGHERELPSSFERLMTFIAHVGTTLNPKDYEKIKGHTFKSFKELAEALIKVLDKAKGNATRLKLSGRVDKKTGKIVPCLPFYTALNKDGEPFLSDNFLGDKVFFSDYELETKEKMEKAKPSDPEATKSEGINVPGEDMSDAGGIDFSSLE